MNTYKQKKGRKQKYMIAFGFSKTMVRRTRMKSRINDKLPSCALMHTGLGCSHDSSDQMKIGE